MCPIRMPRPGESLEEGQLSGSTEDRICQLKPPMPLDFEAINFADSLKKWRQEVELYRDLAMCGREESTKVKLLLYLVGSQRREIYSMMTFEVPKCIVIRRKMKLLRGTSSFCVFKTQANR